MSGPLKGSVGAEALEIWFILDFTLKNYFGADKEVSKIGSCCTAAVNVVCVTALQAFRNWVVGGRKVSPGLPDMRESFPTGQLSKMLSSLSF